MVSSLIFHVLGQSKVSQFDHVVFRVDQNILRFDVTMDEVILVNVSKPSASLVHNGLDLGLPEYAVAVCPFLQLLIQVLIAEFEHNIDLILFSIMNHFKYFHYEFAVV